MSVESLKPSLKRIAAKNIHTEVTVQLAQFIIASEPGTRLPSERELSEKLHVGRSSVREAIRSLAFVGAVHVKQGDGIYVSKVEDADVERHIGLGLLLKRSSFREIIEARRILEIDAVVLATERHDDCDILALKKVMEQLVTDAQDADRAAILDLEFHVTIARAGHNSILLYFLTGMRGLIKGWIKSKITFASKHSDVVSEIISEHQGLFDAIVSRDTQAAAHLMEKHMLQSAKRLAPVIEESHASPDHVFNLMSDV